MDYASCQLRQNRRSASCVELDLDQSTQGGTIYRRANTARRLSEPPNISDGSCQNQRLPHFKPIRTGVEDIGANVIATEPLVLGTNNTSSQKNIRRCHIYRVRDVKHQLLSSSVAKDQSNTFKESNSTMFSESPFMCLYPLHLLAATSSFLHGLQSKQSINGERLWRCVIPVVIGCINAILFVNSLAWPLKGSKSVSLAVHLHSAGAVVVAYATLVLINTRYLYLAVIPIIMLVFIGALWNEISMKSRLAHISNGEATRKVDGDCECSATSNQESSAVPVDDKKAEMLVAVAATPYWVLCLMGQFCGAAGSFVVSPFLLFLSSSLGALTLMIARLPSETAPRLAPVLDLLHRATLVVLLLTAHTVAAEYLGEDMVVAFMPELLAMILWLGAHFDNGGSSLIGIEDSSSSRRKETERVTSYANGMAILAVVVVATALGYLASMDNGMELERRRRCSSWVGRVLPAGCISGFLPYFTALIIRHWPGLRKHSSKGAVHLLIYWANVSLAATTMLLVCACTFPTNLCSLFMHQ